MFNDEGRTLDECRWFCKRYEYATECFRLPSAVPRALHTHPDLFRQGPEQKFWMRQIKIMDFSLLDEKHRNTFQFTDGNRQKWTEGHGNPYQLKELDPELYALYGHQMTVSGSPLTALNYYFRAYALKPNDAVLKLCLGLAYIGLAFKRQTSNRQYQIQQGLALIAQYSELRYAEKDVRYHQEAEYNSAVVWHTLGLMHLALPAYEKCIGFSKKVQERAKETRDPVEDFAVEAAFAMRSIMAINGDLKGALKLSREWLVL
jgi:general transcription factor 3C polypeptide 3 (transcription factor C subunit 4)